MKIKLILFVFLLFTFTYFFSNPTDLRAAIVGDLNFDNKVDILDYNHLLTNFKVPYNIFDYNDLISRFGNNDPNHIQTGAIYWHCCVSHKRNEVEMLLSYDVWRDRQPYFTIPRSGESVDIHEANQQVVDQEIKLAADAGLDYWAIFGLPGDGDGYNYGLNHYLNSVNKKRLKFALMLWTDLTQADKNKYRQVLADSQYLKTPEGRSIIYIWGPQAPDFHTPQETFTALIDIGMSVTGKKPLLVAVDATQTPSQLKAMGFDAQSWYIIPNAGEHGGSFQALTQVAQTLWNNSLNSILQTIPTATTGFDPRPKAINPYYHGYSTNPAWTQQGTSQEIANHLSQANEWVRQHAANATPKTTLIYAWNEIAEGGWLFPTKLGNNQNQRLNALSVILGGKLATVPSSPFTTIPPHHPQGTLSVVSPKSGDSIPSNQQITIRGNAPLAVRLTASMGTSQVFFINDKYSIYDSVPFSIPLPGLPPGTYTLTLSGPDTNNVSIPNINIVSTSSVTRGLTGVTVSGNTVTANFVNNLTFRDWIGIFPTHGDNTSYVDWKWLNNQQGAAPTTSVSSGNVTFSNVAQGDYEVRYIYQDTGHVGVYTPGIIIHVTSF